MLDEQGFPITTAGVVEWEKRVLLQSSVCTTCGKRAVCAYYQYMVPYARAVVKCEGWEREV